MHMRLHRFIGDFDLTKETLSVSDRAHINQWRNVLRLKVGDALVLSDGEGHEATATLIESTGAEIRLALAEMETPGREPKKEVALYCAILKRENFELVAQKATEIGIRQIVPLLSERTLKQGLNRERLMRILVEASEQSGRTTVPELGEPTAFEEAIAAVNPAESTLFDLSGAPFADFDLKDFRTFNLFIGPEGGFAESEVALARDRGLTIASLGSLTLRGETAAIVASYLSVQ